MDGARDEPDYRKACAWWPDATDHVTPVGWPDHMFRFNVLFNGTLLADPDPRLVYSPWKRYAKWRGQGVQLSFPYTDAFHWWEHFGRGGDGMTRQGWTDNPTPVLWSRWPRYGIMIQQQVFGFVPSTPDVETGVEPLFAWVRFSVVDRVEALWAGVPPHNRHPIHVRINRPHIIPTIERKLNLLHVREKSRYPRALTPSATYGAKHGYVLREPDGRARLAVAPGNDCLVEFEDRTPTPNDQMLRLWIRPEMGEQVDLLVPLLPCPAPLLTRTLTGGFDRALAQADAYWKRASAPGAKVSLPEEPVAQSIRQCLKTSRIIAEKNSTDGHYTLLTSSFGYPMVWSVQVAMTLAFALDPWGHHDQVARCLEMFRATQGKVKPTSPFIGRQPGYLAAPPDRNSIPWLPDHGAVLYAVCHHIQLTADAAFTARWTDAIVAACEFIRHARGITGHGGVEGLMPPGAASDLDTPVQAVWTDGWYYKGYTTAVEVLQSMQHPAAAGYAADARAYKAVFVKALREQTRKMPVWTDRNGRQHHLVPMSLSTAALGEGTDNVFNCGDSDETAATPMDVEPRHPFYMDTGPLFLVFSGLLSARDPLMRSSLRWFREGPQHRVYRRDASHWQVPVLDHEMSSCEPYYSWNVFHAHQTGDRARFLEGMYSQFAGAMSRQTFSCFEIRGGQSGMGPQYPCFLMARLAVIDDTLAPDELHLLRLTPLAWLSHKIWASFDDMPTVFGPVCLQFRLSRDGRTLRVKLRPRFRRPPRRVVLHVPPAPDIQSVTLNGRAVADYEPGIKHLIVNP